MRKLEDKTAASVNRALDDLERRYGELFPLIFRTITCDNGPEFADTDGIERSCLQGGKRTKLYYCHPYSAYERGSNENANKLIRRFLPKGSSFEDLADEEVARIEAWMNNYPRKILGYLSAETVFEASVETALSTL